MYVDILTTGTSHKAFSERKKNKLFSYNETINYCLNHLLIRTAPVSFYNTTDFVNFAIQSSSWYEPRKFPVQKKQTNIIDDNKVMSKIWRLLSI